MRSCTSRNHSAVSSIRVILHVDSFIFRDAARLAFRSVVGHARDPEPGVDVSFLAGFVANIHSEGTARSSLPRFRCAFPDSDEASIGDVQRLCEVVAA